MEELRDQTIKADAGKPRLSLVPTEIVTDIARVREYGVNKYGDNTSWRNVEKDRYKDAAYRHFLSYLAEPSGVDEESGLPHLWHLACNVAFLCDLEKQQKIEPEEIPELDVKLTDDPLLKEYLEFRNSKAREEINNARN